MYEMVLAYDQQDGSARWFMTVKELKKWVRKRKGFWDIQVYKVAQGQSIFDGVPVDMHSYYCAIEDGTDERLS